MAVKSETQQRTGLRSLELMYEPVYDADLDDVVAYRAIQRINNPDIGVILPEQFMPVAVRSVQCVKLAVWALENAVEAIAALVRKDIFFEWISVHIPIKFLKSEEFFETLSTVISANEIETRKLRCELPPDLLYESPEEINPLLARISALGIFTYVSDFGGHFCPVMRLSEFDVSGAVIDPEVCHRLQFDEKIEGVFSLIEMVKSMDKQVLLSAVDLKDVAALAEDRECNLMTGEVAGKQRKFSHIR